MGAMILLLTLQTHFLDDGIHISSSLMMPTRYGNNCVDSSNTTHHLQELQQSLINLTYQMEQQQIRLKTLETAMSQVNSPVRNGNYWTAEEAVSCQPVLFIGGGKAGSTTLAAWLKHSPESNYNLYSNVSGFLDSGKEICFGSARKMTSSNFLKHFNPTPKDLNDCPPDRPYLLDGCPNMVMPQQYIRSNEFFPNAKYIMLVRDPIDRLVSQWNDNRPPKPVKDLDLKLTSSGKDKDKLSMYGQLFHTVVHTTKIPSNQIIVVVTELMKRHPQEVMNDVYDFLGISRRKIVKEAPPLNALRHRSVYTWPSESAVRKCQIQKFGNDTQQFLQDLGISILPWNTVRTLLFASNTDVNTQMALEALAKSRNRTALPKIAGYDVYLNAIASGTTNTSEINDWNPLLPMEIHKS